jgi:hypothetical protein
VVSVITEPEVVDRILRCLARRDTRSRDPFEAGTPRGLAFLPEPEALEGGGG